MATKKFRRGRKPAWHVTVTTDRVHHLFNWGISISPASGDKSSVVKFDIQHSVTNPLLAESLEEDDISWLLEIAGVPGETIDQLTDDVITFLHRKMVKAGVRFLEEDYHA